MSFKKKLDHVSPHLRYIVGLAAYNNNVIFVAIILKYTFHEFEANICF